MLKLMTLIITFCIFIIFYSNASAKPLKNFCTNGGFEELNSQRFPIGWNGFAAVGASFGVSKEARSGDYSLLLKSSSDAVVGINRTANALIPLVRGIARFWYKAVSSEVDGKNLKVCIIAMNESGKQEVGREIYTVPAEHVGDGKWHLATIEFNFSSREDAKQVHFAPRINEVTSEKAAGEFLLDDVEVTRIGPKLKIERFGAAKPLIEVGKTTNLRLVVKNIGDEEAVNSEGTLILPSGVVTTESRDVQKFQIEEIKPDQSITLDWHITGKKVVSDTIDVVVDSSLFSTFYLTVADFTEPELQLANESVCLKFFNTKLGYGIFTLEQDNVRLAQSSMFSSLIYRTYNDAVKHVPLFADEVERVDGKYVFKKRFRDVDSILWNFEFVFELPPDGKWVNVTYRASAEKEREVLAFYGPVLYTSRNNRYDAVFPGLEYLEDDEFSSSTLDIAPPNHIRRAPHPNKITIPLMVVSENLSDRSVITGMMWNAKKDWSKDYDRPSAVFASPNRFECMEDYDQMGLFVPSVPKWVEENHTKAKIPYNLQPEDSLEIEAQLFSIHKSKADVSAVYAIPYWIEKYGLPEPLPLPRNSLEKEIEFGLTAYMDTLWVSEEKAWHNTLDWDPWGVRVNPEFARQLWFAAKILPDAPRKDEYLERAALAFEKLGDNLGRELPFYIGKLDTVFPRIKGSVSRLIQTQSEDGSWRFDPDRRNATDEIHHQDYHKLGKEGEAEVGLCAQKAYSLLRYASMTGDKASLEAGLKALDFMRQFKIPRAAQVWEVPVHTPDVLASAHATQAYLSAYKITRDRSYLDTAVYWAYTGLPFVYLWNNDDMPYMLYASIPVFGATWFTHSWFGRAVQWNGLDYAYALFDLAEYDNSFPWRKIARGLTVSGLYQQEMGEKYSGLYPDSYDFMDKTTSAWKLAPRQIIRNLFVMMGYPAEPCIKIARSGEQKVHITAVGVYESCLSNSGLLMLIHPPPEMDSYVMVAGLDKPNQEAVMKNEHIIEEVDEIDSVAEGWKYDNRTGLLFLKLKRNSGISGKMEITITEPQLKYVPQILPPVKKIDWRFNQANLRDWTAAHDLTQLNIQDGKLVTKSTGSDPYMVSIPTLIKASEYSKLLIRMKTSKGKYAQVFWATQTEPISESTSVSFEIKSNGKFHDYLVPVAQNPKWTGIITRLRLDPTDSAGSEIAVESIVSQNEP